MKFRLNNLIHSTISKVQFCAVHHLFVNGAAILTSNFVAKARVSKEERETYLPDLMLLAVAYAILSNALINLEPGVQGFYSCNILLNSTTVREVLSLLWNRLVGTNYLYPQVLTRFQSNLYILQLNCLEGALLVVPDLQHQSIFISVLLRGLAP